MMMLKKYHHFDGAEKVPHLCPSLLQKKNQERMSIYWNFLS